MPAVISSNLPRVLSRIFISAVFIVTGISKILDRNSTMAYMAAHHIPAVSLFYALAVLFELGGGLVLLLSPRPSFGARALILFLIPATLLFHNFWTFEGMERQRQMIQFLKNLAIIGGLLEII